MLAPVCIFTYKRFEHFRRAIEALKDNYLAKETELFICSNAAINKDEIEIVENIRKFARSISGFKNVEVICNEVNKGQEETFVKNITRIINKYGKIIVLEEDMCTNPNFLDFMNQALDYYEHYESVQQIAGYSIPFSNKKINEDVYFMYRSCSWSWGTWEKKWNSIKWDIDNSCLHHIRKNRFNLAGNDMLIMLQLVLDGRMNAWDIKSDYTMYLYNRGTIYPIQSLMMNIGLDGTGEHCVESDNQKFIPIMMDINKRKFKFCSKLEINKSIAKEFRRKFKIRFSEVLRYFLYRNIKMRFKKK